MLEKEFYTVKELAEMLRVKELTIYRMVKRGEIACHNIGRAKRFRRDDVEAYLKRVRTMGKNHNQQEGLNEREKG